METNIKKLASRAGVDSTDLLTRQTARNLYVKLKKQMAIIGIDEVVVLDFSGTEVVDPSFCDEFFGAILKDAADPEHPFYVRLKNISKAAEKNLQSIFSDSIDENTCGFVTETLTRESEYFIGHASAEEREVLEYVRVNQSARAQEIAAALGKDIAETEKILERLCLARLMRAGFSASEKRYYRV